MISTIQKYFFIFIFFFWVFNLLIKLFCLQYQIIYVQSGGNIGWFLILLWTACSVQIDMIAKKIDVIRAGEPEPELVGASWSRVFLAPWSQSRLKKNRNWSRSRSCLETKSGARARATKRLAGSSPDRKGLWFVVFICRVSKQLHWSQDYSTWIPSKSKVDTEYSH